MSVKDITGQSWNYLTAIEFAGIHTYNNGKTGAKWLFRCDCGNEKVMLARSVRKGERKSCGCLRRHGWESMAWHVYKSCYADGNIKFDEFCKLAEMDCFYCGKEPSNYRVRNGNEWIYNGLNRKDHNRGHDLDNVVPCCWDHNEMISDRGHDEFLDEVETIYLRCCVNRKIINEAA